MFFSHLLWILGSISFANEDFRQEALFLPGSNCDTSRIEKDGRMLGVLRYLRDRHNGGQPLRLTSCFRDPERQVQVCRGICRRSQCAGRCSPDSQHSIGVAVDLTLGGGAQRGCRILQEIRQGMLGGSGGVGAYPNGAVHLDLRSARCTWNLCQRVLREDCAAYRSAVVERYVADQIRAGATP